MNGFSTPTHLSRERLSDKIAKDIEARILSGELSIGDKLPSERDLMVYYGVGRPAVREALLWLNKTGILAVSNGDRTRVTEPDPRELLQLLSGAAKMLISRDEGIRDFQKTRSFVEVAMVREASRLATDEDITELEKLLQANADSAEDKVQFSKTDDAFHQYILSIVQNPLLDALYEVVLELLEDQRRMSLSHPDALEKAIAAHRNIFDAISARDADRAELAMRAHLDTVVQTYWQIREQEDDQS
jgi:DNA-binding FadR family transcriptional regulator